MSKRRSAAILTSLIFAAASVVAQGSRPELGSEAPDFTLESSSGEKYSLSQLRGEKKGIGISFSGPPIESRWPSVAER